MPVIKGADACYVSDTAYIHSSQKDDSSMVVNFQGGVLGDEVGLGKTAESTYARFFRPCSSCG